MFPFPLSSSLLLWKWINCNHGKTSSNQGAQWYWSSFRVSFPENYHHLTWLVNPWNTQLAKLSLFNLKWSSASVKKPFPHAFIKNNRRQLTHVEIVLWVSRKQCAHVSLCACPGLCKCSEKTWENPGVLSSAILMLCTSRRWRLRQSCQLPTWVLKVPTKSLSKIWRLHCSMFSKKSLSNL